MKKFVLLNSTIFSLFSHSCLATTLETQPYIHQYAFLSNGFNMQNYNSCKTLIAKNCPAKFTIPDCTNVSIVKQPVCSQFKKLSQAIRGEMTTVFVIQHGKVMLVSQYFPADGQVEYYIITSSNQLIETNIDPRKLNTSLKKKYQKVLLFPIHWGEPKVKLTRNKQQIFDFYMKAHDTCLACEVLISYDLHFTFDKSGKFIDVQLRNIRN